ncbi:MAG: hypothetical protein ACT4PL_11575 [Phycisphaerales bacterium]
MRTVAICRVLYGSDFVGESLSSIYDHVDHILVVISRRIFGGRDRVRYFGHDVYLPHDMDGVEAAALRFRAQHDHADKITIIANRFDTTLVGQMQRLVNDEVIVRFPGCSHVFLVEPDEVYHASAIARLMDVARGSDADEFMVAPHLFWRTWRYASTRSNPNVVLRALKGARSIGPTQHALASQERVRRVDAGVMLHNFGYAASERTVFWKHLASLSFSRDLNMDSPPREEWFDEVWRPWNGRTCRRVDLCPSIGYEHVFPPAADFPFAELPEQMQRRILERPLAEWTEHDRVAELSPPAPQEPAHALT